MQKHLKGWTWAYHLVQHQSSQICQYVSLQAKKEAQTFIWLAVLGGADGAATRAVDVAAALEAGPTGGPP